MSANSPLPLLIKPDLRRRLQQRYEEAQRLTTQQPPDFRRIHELLAECLHVDAGNTLYLDALMANLRRREAAKPARKTSWLGRWFGDEKREKIKAGPSTEPLRDTSHEAMGPSALRSAADRLWESPLQADLLRSLAEAAGEANLEQAEARYWQLAVECAPEDASLVRGLALALTRQGRFEEAATQWRRLLLLIPADTQAEAALAILQPTAPQRATDVVLLRHIWGNQPGDTESGLRLAESLIAAEQFAEAEKVLTDLQSAAGADLQVLEYREKLLIAKSQQRVAIARRWKTFDDHPKAHVLATELETEHRRLEVEIWNLRTERMPKDWSVRLELARRLKQMGNFSGAIQRLEEAQRLKVNHPGAYIELGECWQHLRQFEKALRLYEKAVSKAQTLSANDEVLKLARYRAGVLSAALGQRDFARQNLQAILAADPDYKDARQRLDKLGPN